MWVWESGPKIDPATGVSDSVKLHIIFCQVYFLDVIVSKMRIKSSLTDMSKCASTIRRARHALFLYELKGYRYILFCWCHDPPRSPQTLSAGQGPDIRTDVGRISDPRTRTPTPDGTKLIN